MKRVLLLISTVLILFGCAAPEKKIETMFYPGPPQEPRLQFLVSITDEKDIGKKSSAFQEFLVGETQSAKTIGRPFDIGAVKGKIYISDRTYNKILIIDLEKKEFDYIKNEKEGVFVDLAGIWVTEDGHKYAADFGRKQILVFNAADTFIKVYGENGQFDKPIDVAVYENRIYVCDMNKNKVIVIDKNSGETLQEIGELGIKEGQFYKPTHVVVDGQGSLYVNDAFNYRIQKFDPNGNFIKSFGYQGDIMGSFARPKGVDISKDGHLYAVDTAFENVQIFDDETTDLLLFFGGFGPAAGSMYLPNGIYIDYLNTEYFSKYTDKDFSVKYLVYVGNMLGDKKLNVYGFGDWIGKPLPGIGDKKDKK